MTPIDPTSAKALIEVLVAGFAVLGGTMAYFSGYAAYACMEREDPPSLMAHSINEGVGEGFGVGAPSAVIAIIIMGWT